MYFFESLFCEVRFVMDVFFVLLNRELVDSLEPLDFLASKDTEYVVKGNLSDLLYFYGFAV